MPTEEDWHSHNYSMTSQTEYVLRTSIPNYGMKNVELHIRPAGEDKLRANLSARTQSGNVNYSLEGTVRFEDGFDVIRLLMYRENDPFASHLLILKQQHAGTDISGFYSGLLLNFIQGDRKPRKPTLPSIDDLVALERLAGIYDDKSTVFEAALTKK